MRVKLSQLEKQKRYGKNESGFCQARQVVKEVLLSLIQLQKDLYTKGQTSSPVTSESIVWF